MSNAAINWQEIYAIYSKPMSYNNDNEQSIEKELLLPPEPPRPEYWYEGIGFVPKDFLNINQSIINAEICINLAKTFEKIIEKEDVSLDYNVIRLLVGCSEDIIRYVAGETKLKSLIGEDSYMDYKESSIKHAINQEVSYAPEIKLCKEKLFNWEIDYDGRYDLKNYEKSYLASYKLYNSLFESFASLYSGVYTYSNHESALFTECLQQLPTINEFAILGPEKKVSFTDIN